jgi:Co/Zn/Cd efflux system component
MQVLKTVVDGRCHLIHSYIIMQRYLFLPNFLCIVLVPAAASTRLLELGCLEWDGWICTADHLDFCCTKYVNPASRCLLLHVLDCIFSVLCCVAGFALISGGWQWSFGHILSCLLTCIVIVKSLPKLAASYLVEISPEDMEKKIKLELSSHEMIGTFRICNADCWGCGPRATESPTMKSHSARRLSSLLITSTTPLFFLQVEASSAEGS